MERNVEIVTDSEKKKIVRIHNIRFKGKRSIDWGQVREYLKDYVGATHEIAETKDIIYIESDLPDEYSGSRYTYKLLGTLAKAKANAAQGIPELLETAGNKRFLENRDPRHIRNAGMDGIDMMHILNYLYMMKMEKSRGIIVLGQQC